MIDKTDEYVGIVTKQNATKDVPWVDNMNVKNKIGASPKDILKTLQMQRSQVTKKTWYSKGATMAQLQKAPRSRQKRSIGTLAN